MIFSGLLVWILSVICGVLLGRSRNQLLLGLLLTLFLGPIGAVILICLPNAKLETEEHEKRLGSLEEQLNTQRDQQSRQLLENAKATRASKGDTPVVTSLRIARNGKDLGEMNLDVIKTMLGDGQLAPEDFYLDAASNEWMPLDCHPALIR